MTVVSTPAEQVAQVVQSKGRKQEFVAPSPKPLVLSVAEQTTPKVEDHVEQKPSLIFDGNQHPVLMVTGEQLKLWEQLGQAISAAKVKITDRNQSSGLYFIELSQTNNKKESYLLKLSSTTGATFQMYLQTAYFMELDNSTNSGYAYYLNSVPGLFRVELLKKNFIITNDIKECKQLIRYSENKKRTLLKQKFSNIKETTYYKKMQELWRAI